MRNSGIVATSFSQDGFPEVELNYIMNRRKMEMKKTIVLMLIVIGLLSLCSIIQAAPVQGSIAVSTFTITQNGNDLSTSTLFDLNTIKVDTLFTLGNAQDFSWVPVLTVLPAGQLNTGNFGSFYFGDAVFGKWQSSSGTIVNQSAGFLDILMNGSFTPGSNPNWAGYSSSTGIMRLAFTQSGNISQGGTTSVSGTMKVVPEASTLVGFSSALLMAGPGMIGWLRRRRA